MPPIIDGSVKRIDLYRLFIFAENRLQNEPHRPRRQFPFRLC